MKKTAKTVLYAPYYFLSLFTTAKSFKRNPLIGSRLLNRMGLHVIRLVLAHAVFALKLRFLTFMVSRQDYRDYKANGFLLKENFLPAADFEALKNEARNFKGEAWQCVQGDTITWRTLLDKDNLKNLPECRKLVESKAFLNPLKFCGAKNDKPFFYIQQIQNGFLDAKSDPQKILHADTFHPTMKAWLFLQDVGEDGGPFTYVPGSNRLTWKRLVWEYKKSIGAAHIDDGYSEKGSFRIDDAELASLDLAPAKGFAVKANTLVIANTYGFHRRGDTKEGRATRLEIWAMSRLNPFNPLPGINVVPFAHFRDKMYLKYLRHADAEAKKRGKRSPWHKAPESPAA